MQSDTTPDTTTPVALEDHGGHGDDKGFAYPWDDWATERRAQLLLADALAVCVPNERGEVVADTDALGRLEMEYNEAVAHAVASASERHSRINPAYNTISVSFGKMNGFRHGKGIVYSTLGGWSYGPVRKIREELLLPNTTVCAEHVPRGYPGAMRPEHRVPLPPGPHKGCGWFDVVTAALVLPQDDHDRGARPLDALLCTASIALARALISMGDERTAPLYRRDAMRFGGVPVVDQRPPDDRGEWSTARVALNTFISLMQRIHATWSLYLPLVAPTEHAINRTLMPGIVE